MTSPSQPETVFEMDEEDDSDDFRMDEDLLADHPEVEEIQDCKIMALLNSGEKPKIQTQIAIQEEVSQQVQEKK